MGKRYKKSKNNPQNKVQAISPKVQKYRDLLDQYREVPCLPTLFALLDHCLESGIDLAPLTNELETLVAVDDDQFYGAAGSAYMRAHPKLKVELSSYRPDQPTTLGAAQVLWRILGKVRGDELWVYGSVLIGATDFYALSQPIASSEPLVEGYLPENQAPKADPYLMDLISSVVEAQVAKEEANRELYKWAMASGLDLIPWSAYLNDLLEDRPALRAALFDFNEYLSGFFKTTEELDFPEAGLVRDLVDLDEHNLSALGKIASFILLFRLFKKHCTLPTQLLEKFFSERQTYISIQSLHDCQSDCVEFYLAVENLVLMLGVIGLNSYEHGLFSKEELTRSHLRCLGFSPNIGTCLLTLPSNGLVHVLRAISAYEGDAVGVAEHKHLRDIVSVSNFGTLFQFDFDVLDQLYEDAFEGVHESLVGEVRTKTEIYVKKWKLPLFLLEGGIWIDVDIWNSRTFIEKASDSLDSSSFPLESSVCFSREQLQVSELLDCLDQFAHPALFAKRFCNIQTFSDFDESNWLDFSRSLKERGLPRFSCAVMAMYISILSVKNFLNLGVEYDPCKISKSIAGLVDLNSFELIRESLSYLLDSYESVPVLFRGSLFEFIDQDRQSPRRKPIFDLESYRLQVVEGGIKIDVLSQQAQEALVKGYYLARERENFIFNLCGDAANNYFLALEGELRSRLSELDDDVAVELKYLGIEVRSIRASSNSGARKNVIAGLGAFASLCDKHALISREAMLKLSTLHKIFNHPKVVEFSFNIRLIAKMRNSLAHGENRRAFSLEELDKLEVLLLGPGGVFAVLCDTR